MISIQAVYFTSRTQEWHRFAEALGLRPWLPLDPEWSEFDGDGVLAIHHADPAGPAAGTTKLQLIVDQLDHIETNWHAANVAAERSTLAGVGEMITARSTSGTEVSAIAAATRRPRWGSLSVMPILYQLDQNEPERILKAAGLSVRIRSTNGIWTDLQADRGGLVGLHTGTPQIELSFEYAGNLEEFATSINDAGYHAEVIDEAYDRTLVVNTPDEWALRINGAQDDLHGYIRGD
jgi:hypothetical protein